MLQHKESCRCQSYILFHLFINLFPWFVCWVIILQSSLWIYKIAGMLINNGINIDPLASPITYHNAEDPDLFLESISYPTIPPNIITLTMFNKMHASLNWYTSSLLASLEVFLMKSTPILRNTNAENASAIARRKKSQYCSWYHSWCIVRNRKALLNTNMAYWVQIQLRNSQ